MHSPQALWHLVNTNLSPYLVELHCKVLQLLLNLFVLTQNDPTMTKYISKQIYILLILDAIA